MGSDKWEVVSDHWEGNLSFSPLFTSYSYLDFKSLHLIFCPSPRTSFLFFIRVNPRLSAARFNSRATTHFITLTNIMMKSIIIDALS